MPIFLFLIYLLVIIQSAFLFCVICLLSHLNKHCKYKTVSNKLEILLNIMQDYYVSIHWNWSADNKC